MDVLRTIVNTVSVHVQKGGTMTTQEDVLECLRPFCADVTVSASIKTTVLQLMEESFDLSGEDTFLLLFYQTDAVVSSTWNKKVAFPLAFCYMKKSFILDNTAVICLLTYSYAFSLWTLGIINRSQFSFSLVMVKLTLVIQ